jgi:hypothetical protein
MSRHRAPASPPVHTHAPLISSGIFIFIADERFLREKDDDTEEVRRPSENVVFELGAASILYENRILIFKEGGVDFPGDFSDLGYRPGLLGMARAMVNQAPPMCVFDRIEPWRCYGDGHS